ncbi:hypothetical protein F4810DRAFT_510847 [Camillea tinctor]|nr:hypothetical protein F4810DRAFT_510847 [Camillea tinctor]
MREFMDYVQTAFYAATGWNRDNSYSSLNATSDSLLRFPTPRGLRLTLSSLATPRFATSYQLGSVGVVDGSISYLFTTVALNGEADGSNPRSPGDAAAVIAQSEKIPLPDLLRSYRPLVELSKRREHAAGGGSRDNGEGGEGSSNSNSSSGVVEAPEMVDKHVLAYGRLYLPMSMLEALVVRRISPTLQMQVSAVSDQTLRNGGTVLGMLQYDEGRYGIEGLASSDGGLLGVRGLYNFGGDAANLGAPAGGAVEQRSGNGNGNGNGERERIYGRFSTGAELYYGTLNKSGGMSLGARFATLPPHKGTPLTATMTINPLMGNISWTYSVMAGSYCSLATKLDFNVYSYESDWAVGMELWRRKGAWAIENEEVLSEPSSSLTSSPSPSMPQPPLPLSPPQAVAPPVAASPVIPPPPVRTERSFQAKMEWRLDDPLPSPEQAPANAPRISDEKSEPSKKKDNLKRKKKNGPSQKDKPLKEKSFPAKPEPKLDDKISDTTDEDQYAGVLKARLDQHWRLGLLWEGRVKSLLFSLGSGIDLRRLDSPFRTLGLEVQFSS